jgi:hypothetical protein
MDPFWTKHRVLVVLFAAFSYSAQVLPDGTQCSPSLFGSVLVAGVLEPVVVHPDALNLRAGSVASPFQQKRHPTLAG